MMCLEQTENCFRFNPRVFANNMKSTISSQLFILITLQGSVRAYTHEMKWIIFMRRY